MSPAAAPATMPSSVLAPPSGRAPGRTASLDHASRAVRRRVFLGNWFGLLGHSAIPVFAAGVAVFAGLRVYGVRMIVTRPDLAEALLGAGVVLAWASATAALAAARVPDAVGALALWDERARRQEMFVSAFCFRRESETTAVARLHLARATAALPGALASLGEAFPLRLPPRAAVVPAAFLAFLASGVLRLPLSPEDLPLADAARARAREVAASLGEDGKLLDPLAGLDDEERKELEKLKASLDDAAKRMERLDDATPREVLEDLERRAREAEALAERLAGDEGGLSEEFIAELARHADTAPVAEALRAKAPERIAGEAERLARRLDAEPEMSIEERRRIEEALARALGEATTSDLKTVVGKGSSRAHDALRRDRLLEAAREFEKIAEHYRRAAERSRARRQLEQLADGLRRSGSRIFGRNQAGMRRLGAGRYARQGQPRAGQPVPLGQMGTARPGARNLPLGAGRPGAPRGARFGTPMPGSGRCPVPGTAPGTGAGQLAGPGAGQVPIPGTGMCPGSGLGACQSGGAGAGVGGLRAGHGSAAYGNTPTSPFGARRTGVVAAAPGEGESDARVVEGEAHAEASGRSAREMAIEFVKAEEEALDEEPLPLSRREQVLRYFTGLRRQIENDE